MTSRNSPIDEGANQGTGRPLRGAAPNMAELTAEQFAQRILHLNLLDDRQLETVWSHFGTRDVSLQDFSESLVRRGLLTNFQVERLLKGEKNGFFYGDYKVLYFVGNGSFARVYRAVHTESGKVVALKVLRKRFSDNPLESARFMREGELGATLRHPNIVPIYEVHSQRRTFFLVMAFVEGQSLREFVKIRRQVEPLESTRIMAGIISGLAYAAEKGITHRDLKLSNVLISSDGQPQLVDFGLAAMDTTERGESYTNARTIEYAGLEKVTGVRKDDSRSDIYFAGGIYYHMLCGKPPLSETRDRMQRMNMARFREIKPIRTLVPDLPPVVEAIVNKSMELDRTSVTGSRWKCSWICRKRSSRWNRAPRRVKGLKNWAKGIPRPCCWWNPIRQSRTRFVKGSRSTGIECS